MEYHQCILQSTITVRAESRKHSWDGEQIEVFRNVGGGAYLVSTNSIIVEDGHI